MASPAGPPALSAAQLRAFFLQDLTTIAEESPYRFQADLRNRVQRAIDAIQSDHGALLASPLPLDVASQLLSLIGAALDTGAPAVQTAALRLLQRLAARALLTGESSPGGRAGDGSVPTAAAGLACRAAGSASKDVQLAVVRAALTLGTAERLTLHGDALGSCFRALFALALSSPAPEVAAAATGAALQVVNTSLARAEHEGIADAWERQTGAGAGDGDATPRVGRAIAAGFAAGRPALADRPGGAASDADGAGAAAARGALQPLPPRDPTSPRRAASPSDDLPDQPTTASGPPPALPPDSEPAPDGRTAAMASMAEAADLRGLERALWDAAVSGDAAAGGPSTRPTPGAAGADQAAPASAGAAAAAAAPTAATAAAAAPPSPRASPAPPASDAAAPPGAPPAAGLRAFADGIGAAVQGAMASASALHAAATGDASGRAQGESEDEDDDLGKLPPPAGPPPGLAGAAQAAAHGFATGIAAAGMPRLAKLVPGREAAAAVEAEREALLAVGKGGKGSDRGDLGVASHGARRGAGAGPGQDGNAPAAAPSSPEGRAAGASPAAAPGAAAARAASPPAAPAAAPPPSPPATPRDPRRALLRQMGGAHARELRLLRPAERDAAALLGALCRQAARDVGHPGSPAAHEAAAGRLLALRLLARALADPARDWQALRPAAAAPLRAPICLALLRNSCARDAGLAGAAAAGLAAVLRSPRLRAGAKAELGALYALLGLRPLEDPAQRTAGAPAAAAAAWLLAAVAAEPRTLVDVYVNFDCSLNASDLYERSVKALRAALDSTGANDALGVHEPSPHPATRAHAHEGRYAYLLGPPLGAAGGAVSSAGDPVAEAAEAALGEGAVAAGGLAMLGGGNGPGGAAGPGGSGAVDLVGGRGGGGGSVSSGGGLGLGLGLGLGGSSSAASAGRLPLPSLALSALASDAPSHLGPGCDPLVNADRLLEPTHGADAPPAAPAALAALVGAGLAALDGPALGGEAGALGRVGGGGRLGGGPGGAGFGDAGRGGLGSSGSRRGRGLRALLGAVGAGALGGVPGDSDPLERLLHEHRRGLLAAIARVGGGDLGGGVPLSLPATPEARAAAARQLLAAEREARRHGPPDAAVRELSARAVALVVEALDVWAGPLRPAEDEDDEGEDGGDDEDRGDASASASASAATFHGSAQDLATVSGTAEGSYALIEAAKAVKSSFEAGVARFRRNPRKGLAELRQAGLVPASASGAAAWLLRHRARLGAVALGELFGDPDEDCQAVMHAWIEAEDYAGLELDQALRELLRGFRLPGEAQKIDRIVQKFADRYAAQNPDRVCSADGAYILAFAIVMLNTDAHNPHAERLIGPDDFVSMAVVERTEESAEEDARESAQEGATQDNGHTTEEKGRASENGAAGGAAPSVGNGLDDGAGPSVGNGLDDGAAPSVGNGLDDGAAPPAGDGLDDGAAPPTGNGVPGASATENQYPTPGAGAADATSGIAAASPASFSGSVSSSSAVSPSSFVSEPSSPPPSSAPPSTRGPIPIMPADRLLAIYDRVSSSEFSVDPDDLGGGGAVAPGSDAVGAAPGSARGRGAGQVGRLAEALGLPRLAAALKPLAAVSSWDRAGARQAAEAARREAVRAEVAASGVLAGNRWIEAAHAQHARPMLLASEAQLLPALADALWGAPGPQEAARALGALLRLASLGGLLRTPLALPGAARELAAAAGLVGPRDSLDWAALDPARGGAAPAPPGPDRARPGGAARLPPRLAAHPAPPVQVAAVACLTRLAASPRDANALGPAWVPILRALSELEAARAGGPDRAAVDAADREALRAAEEAARAAQSSIGAMLPGRWAAALGLAAARPGTGVVAPPPSHAPVPPAVAAWADGPGAADVERALRVSPRLSADGCVDYMRALCTASREELRPYVPPQRARGPGPRERPRIYLLQRVLEAALANSHRPKRAWERVWALASAHLARSACLPDAAAGPCAADALRQVATRLLERRELPGLPHQAEALRPLRLVLSEAPSPGVRRLAVEGVAGAAAAAAAAAGDPASGGGLRSGWGELVAVLARGAADVDIGVVRAALLGLRPAIAGLYASAEEEAEGGEEGEAEKGASAGAGAAPRASPPARRGSPSFGPHDLLDELVSALVLAVGEPVLRADGLVPGTVPGAVVLRGAAAAAAADAPGAGEGAEATDRLLQPASGVSPSSGGGLGAAPSPATSPRSEDAFASPPLSPRSADGAGYAPSTLEPPRRSGDAAAALPAEREALAASAAALLGDVVAKVAAAADRGVFGRADGGASAPAAVPLSDLEVTADGTLVPCGGAEAVRGALSERLRAAAAAARHSPRAAAARLPRGDAPLGPRAKRPASAAEALRAALAPLGALVAFDPRPTLAEAAAGAISRLAERDGETLSRCGLWPVLVAAGVAPLLEGPAAWAEARADAGPSAGPDPAAAPDGSTLGGGADAAGGGAARAPPPRYPLPPTLVSAHLPRLVRALSCQYEGAAPSLLPPLLWALAAEAATGGRDGRGAGRALGSLRELRAVLDPAGWTAAAEALTGALRGARAAPGPGPARAALALQRALGAGVREFAAAAPPEATVLVLDALSESALGIGDLARGGQRPAASAPLDALAGAPRPPRLRQSAEGAVVAVRAHLFAAGLLDEEEDAEEAPDRAAKGVESAGEGVVPAGEGTKGASDREASGSAPVAPLPRGRPWARSWVDVVLEGPPAPPGLPRAPEGPSPPPPEALRRLARPRLEALAVALLARSASWACAHEDAPLSGWESALHAAQAAEGIRALRRLGPEAWSTTHDAVWPALAGLARSPSKAVRGELAALLEARCRLALERDQDARA